MATDPEIIVLDEPTAGLDPQGSRDMMQLFMTLNKDYNKTVIMVTHDMDHVLNYADEVLVLKDGQVFFSGTTQNFFEDTSRLDSLEFVVPKVLQLKASLKQRGIDTGTELDLAIIAQMVKEGRHE